jgi:heptosyltransferase II
MNPDRILFIQTAFLGDAILALPSIQKLKELNPDSAIDVLCIPETKEIFSASPSVDNAVVIDKKGEHKSLTKTYKFIKQLKQNGYTRIYSSHRSFRTALIVILLEVRESFGFDNSSLMHVYKILIPYHLNKHEVQRNLDLIGYKYDDETWRIIPKLSSGEFVIDKVKSFLNQNNLCDGFIAIAPGSVWNTKKYPLEYFEAMTDHFIKNDFKLVYIGGEKDYADCSRLASRFSGKVVDASGQFSITESIELLKSAKLLISNDSAPTHMGMCADIKVITIYCSTVPGFGFYPYNKKSASISFDDLKCKPCGVHGYHQCPIKTFDCGLKLLPEVIIKKAEEMLRD